MDVRMHAIPRFLVPSSIQEEEAGAVIVDIPEVTQIFQFLRLLRYSTSSLKRRKEQ
jgi:hypothetical protein